MRILTQPGAPLKPRRLVVFGAAAGELRVALPAGVDMLEGLIAVMDARGIRDAAVIFLGGTFTRLAYLTGQPDDSGARVATYGAPTLLTGPVVLLGANAILGRDGRGGPLLHCHAVAVDREGRVHGGHLPPGSCPLGNGGATARVAVLDGAGFRVAYDSETNYPIFHPAAIVEEAQP